MRFRPTVERFEERDVPAFFTFVLPGETGYGDFTDPSGIDSSQAAQSIPVTGLALAFQGVTLTNADALATPTAEYRHGVFVGLTAAFNVATTAGAYQQLLLNVDAATGIDLNGLQSTVPIAAPNPQPFVTIDLRGTNVFTQMNVTVTLADQTTTSVLINFTNQDWQDPNNSSPVVWPAATRISNELWAHGLDVVANGSIITIRGGRIGNVPVDTVQVSITGLAPGLKTALPTLRGYYGAVDLPPRFNLPTIR